MSVKLFAVGKLRCDLPVGAERCAEVADPAFTLFATEQATIAPDASPASLTDCGEVLRMPASGRDVPIAKWVACAKISAFAERSFFSAGSGPIVFSEHRYEQGARGGEQGVET
jgi:hypothetical protein